MGFLTSISAAAAAAAAAAAPPNLGKLGSTLSNDSLQILARHLVDHLSIVSSVHTHFYSILRCPDQRIRQRQS